MSWLIRLALAFFVVLTTQFISIHGQARSPWQDTATEDAFIQSFLGTISGSEAFTQDQLDDMSTIGDSLVTAMDTMTRNNKISQSKLQALNLGFASSMAEIAAVEQGGQSVSVKTNEIADALNSAFLQTTGAINTRFVDEVKNLSSIIAQASASEVAYATAGSDNAAATVGAAAATNTDYSAGPVFVSWKGYEGVPQEQRQEGFRLQGPSIAASVASGGFGGYRQEGQAAQTPEGYGPVRSKVFTTATDFDGYIQGRQDQGLSGTAALSLGGYGPVSATVVTAAADFGGYEQGDQGFAGPETPGQDRVVSTGLAGNFVVSGQGNKTKDLVYEQDQDLRGYGSAGPGFQEPVNTASTVVAGGYGQGIQDQGLLGSGAQGPGGYGPFSITITLDGLGSYRQGVTVQEPPKSELQGPGSAAIGELGVYDAGVQEGKGPGQTTTVSDNTEGFGSYTPVIQELQRPSKPEIQELSSASAATVIVEGLDNNAVRGNEGPFDLRIQGSGGSTATTAVAATSEIGGPGLQEGQVQSVIGGPSAVAEGGYGLGAQQSAIPDVQGPSGLGRQGSGRPAVAPTGLEGYGPIAQAPSSSDAQIPDGYGPGNFAASTILGGYEVVAQGPSGPQEVSSVAVSADGIEYGGLQRPPGPGNLGTEGVAAAMRGLEVYAPRVQVSSAPIGATAIGLPDYRPVSQAPSATEAEIGLQNYVPVPQAPSAPLGAIAIGLQNYVPAPQVPSSPEGATAVGMQDYGPVVQAPSAPVRAIAIGLPDYRPVAQAPSAIEAEIGLQNYVLVPQTPSAPLGAIAIGSQNYGPVTQAPSAPKGETSVGLQDYGSVPQAPSAPEGATAIGLLDYVPAPQVPFSPEGATAVGMQDYGPV
ncbi:major ampullate spidroin 2B variant 1, partial [Trichonephila inaurata madagascariensis]